MLGVMDEEGVLEYGQVYFQYSADINSPKENLIIHEGEKKNHIDNGSNRPRNLVELKYTGRMTSRKAT